MTLKLTSNAMKLIERKLAAGGFDGPEAVVMAGLAALDQTPAGDFAPGEMDALLAAGERSIKRSGTLDGDKALAARRKRRQRTRRPSF